MMRSRTREENVEEFHKAFNLDINSSARISLLNLRARLIEEESREVIEAIDAISTEIIFSKKPSSDHWSHLLKELCDLQYVLSGTIVALKDLPTHVFDAAFNRVHDSNMSKLDEEGNAIYDEKGKVLKSKNYREPDLSTLV
jgi:predicted HAD superfamily Cof-like phosphohydrolase